MFTGRVARVFPEQRYGIVEPFRMNGVREVIIALKDQRIIERGQINPEKTRTIVPEMGTIVKFLPDFKSGITPIAFLWAQVPKIETNAGVVQQEKLVFSRPIGNGNGNLDHPTGSRGQRPDWKRSKPGAHNYLWQGENKSPPSRVEEIPETVQTVQGKVPDSPINVTEPLRNSEQENVVVQQDKTVCLPSSWVDVGKKDSDMRDGRRKPKKDGKKTKKRQGSSKGKRNLHSDYPEYGRTFRYLERSVNAEPIPGCQRVSGIDNAKPAGMPQSKEVAQVVQSGQSQIKKTGSVPRFPKPRQEPEDGSIMPDWVAKEGVKTILSGRLSGSEQ